MEHLQDIRCDLQYCRDRKANNLKPYEYFEHLLTVIPEHMEDTDRSFLEELLPWSPALPENIRK